MRSPKAFLFDEPLSNLDAKLRVETRGEIKRLQRRLRTTTLYVTHDQTEAMGLADRVVVMSRGRVHQHGPPDEIWNRPADEFVASFVGSAALVEAYVRDGRLELPWGTVALPSREMVADGAALPDGPVVADGPALPDGGSPLPDGKVSVAIGRDALWVSVPGSLPQTASSPDGAGITIPGTVCSRVFRGDDFLLGVRTDGPVLHLTADGHAAPAVGERIQLELDPARIRVLR